MRQLFMSAMLFFIANNVYSAARVDFSVKGEITSTTCKVELGESSMVFLPAQNQRELAVADAVAGKTPFKITLVGCSTSAFLYFQNDQPTITRTGRLANVLSPDSGGAENIELELLNESGAPINLNAVKRLQNIGAATTDATADAAIFNFFVQYHALSAVAVGEVRSSLTFSVEFF